MQIDAILRVNPADVGAAGVGLAEQTAPHAPQVFDMRQWTEHRSSDRYLNNILMIPK